MSNHPITTYKPRNAVSHIINSNPAALAVRLELLIVNGKKLLPEERLALAQYSVTTGLNPFVGECYYLPGIGPGPGIAGWRVKAQDQLDWEAQKARIPLARFWCEYQKPGDGQGNFDPSKDIAVLAVLHDSLTKTEWEKRTLSHYVELVKAGIKKEDGAWDVAKELAGPEPTWTAIGVVRSGENFGPSEKMDRYERACKRAEKAAIRKRFQRVYLPEPVGFDQEDVLEAQVREVVAETPRTEAQTMNELGYSAPTQVEQRAQEVEPEQSVLEYKPGQPAEQPPMTLAEAEAVINSEGKKYGEIDTPTLAIMANTISKAKVHKPEHDVKLLAIQTILKARNEAQSKEGEK